MANHLSREQLLRYVDGELATRGARKATEHLRKCENCAVELDRFKEHLATIAEAQVEVFERSIPPPPKPWPWLEPRFDIAARMSDAPFWRRFVSPFENVWKIPLASGSAALILVLIGLLIWGPVQSVSAKEVLQRATAADRARLTITAQQVVRQNVRLKKKHGLRRASAPRAWNRGSRRNRLIGTPAATR